VIINAEKATLLAGIDKATRKVWEAQRTEWLNLLMENKITQEQFPSGLIDPAQDYNDVFFTEAYLDSI